MVASPHLARYVISHFKHILKCKTELNRIKSNVSHTNRRKFVTIWPSDPTVCIATSNNRSMHFLHTLFTHQRTEVEDDHHHGEGHEGIREQEGETVRQGNGCIATQ